MYPGRSYFNHSLNTHYQPKIRELISTFGAEAYAIYFVLIEVHGLKRAEDQSVFCSYQDIDPDTIARILKVKIETVVSCLLAMKDLSLISILPTKKPSEFMTILIHGVHGNLFSLSDTKG